MCDGCCNCPRACKCKECPGNTDCSMRMKPWGESLKPPKPELAAGKAPSVVLEFNGSSHDDWLHSIEFIPVEHNGSGDAGNAYMNVNVYRKYPKGHRLAGQKDCMDTRTSMKVYPQTGRFAAPALGDFMDNLNEAAKRVVESIPQPKTKLLRDIDEMKAKLAEMEAEAQA